jgi:superfamily I DNA/RNA helicase
VRNQGIENLVFQRKQEEMDFILQSISSRIASGQALASEIAIGCRLSDDLNTIVSALHKADIPYYKMVQDRRVGDKSGVVLLTLHGLKGLEFKHVYLCCVNADTAPFDLRFTADLDDPEALTNLEKSERSLYYVAASRAIISLTLTGSGRASKWFESLRA